MSYPFTAINRNDNVYGTGSDVPPISSSGQDPSSPHTGSAPIMVVLREITDAISSRFLQLADTLQATLAKPPTRPVIVAQKDGSDADVDPSNGALAKLSKAKANPELQRLMEAIVDGSLSLHDKLGASTMGALCQLLQDPDCGLVALTIQASEMGTEGMRLLSEALKINRTVTRLDFSWNKLDAACAALLSEALKVNPVVAELNLEYNCLYAAGAASLSEMLKANSTLTKLNLNCTGIATAGVVSLSEALKTNTSLTTLDLGANKIDAAGISALAKMLETNKSLTEIYIGANEIGSDSAFLLSKALKVNCTLTKLRMAWNNIGAIGAAHLSEALEINHTLTTLDIGNNLIGCKGAASLSKMLMTNRTLTELRAGKNDMRNTGIALLSQALKSNNTLTKINLAYEDVGYDYETEITSSLRRNLQYELLMQGAALSMELASGLQYPAEISALLIEQIAALPRDPSKEHIDTIADLNAAINYSPEKEPGSIFW